MNRVRDINPVFFQTYLGILCSEHQTARMEAEEKCQNNFATALATCRPEALFALIRYVNKLRKHAFDENK